MRPRIPLCAVCPLLLIVSATLTRAQVTPTYDDVTFAVASTDGGGTITLRTDIYKPAGATGPTPVVLWIHGGGWQGGTYNTPPLAVNSLLSRGIAVASVQYRLSGTSIFPAQIHDVKGAARFLRANAATFGLDTNRMGAWGTSAGGHLTALLATSGDVAAAEGTTGGNSGFSSRIFAGVDYFGPTDLLNINLDVTTPPGSTLDHDAPNSPESRLIGFGGAGEGIGVLRANQNNPAAPFPQLMSLITLVNPITHVSTDDPAMFIAHGLSDTTVPNKQSQRLFDAMTAARLNVSYTPVPGAGHGNLGTATETAAVDFLASQLLPTPGMSNWNNPFGGAWATASNWHGGALPTAASDALFNFNANYTTTLAAPTQTRSITVGRGNVTLDLNHQGMTLAGSLSLGRSTGPRASLTLIGGGTVTAANAFVGGTSSAAAGFATLIVGQSTALMINGTLRNWSNGTIICETGGQTLIRSGALSNSGTIDLTDNAMLLTATPLQVVHNQIASARHGGAWDQAGITSSSAREHPEHITTLGSLSGQQYLNAHGPAATFHGLPVAASDVLVEYTFHGDANLSGDVDFDDYVRIDIGFNAGLSGWFNGDFNYSGTVNFDDYVMIDVAFNRQNGTLQRAIEFLQNRADTASSDPTATGVHIVELHAAQFGEAYAQRFLATVPEASLLPLLPLLAKSLARRPRRRRQTSPQISPD